jgi:hypothetical protein
LSTEELYGLEAANVEIEKAPIQVGPAAQLKIRREREENVAIQASTIPPVQEIRPSHY